MPVYRVELISPVGASGSARLLPGPFYVSVHAGVIQCVHAASCNSFLFTLSFLGIFGLFFPPNANVTNASSLLCDASKSVETGTSSSEGLVLFFYSRRRTSDLRSS